MFEWNASVQRMLDCVEENLTGPLTLEMLAGCLGYSPCYCSRQFHRYAGISLRDYIRLRKVSAAVIDLRDTRERIIDIAVKYGFSSHEAFTRSFRKTYGMSPAAYRRTPKPLPLLIKRNVFNPHYLGLGGFAMAEDASKNVSVGIQVLPAHKFIGIRSLDADNYWDFWAVEEGKKGRDYCSEVSGLLESIRSFNGQVGGWFYAQGKRGFLYGIEVPVNYAGEVPEGMECTRVPEAPYVVFHHPAYDYNTMERAVYEALNRAVEGWTPAEHGYEWDDTLPTYQRHDPARYGQAIMRPVRRRSA